MCAEEHTPALWCLLSLTPAMPCHAAILTWHRAAAAAAAVVISVGVWPPQDVPGWVYVPGVQQVAHPKHNQPLKWQPGQARPAPLCRLLLSEADQGKVITTSGRIIHVSQVWQPQDWKRCCSSSQGMYVPERQWREWAGSCAWLHATREAPTSPGECKESQWVMPISTLGLDSAGVFLWTCWVHFCVCTCCELW